MTREMYYTPKPEQVLKLAREFIGSPDLEHTVMNVGWLLIRHGHEVDPKMKVFRCVGVEPVPEAISTENPLKDEAWKQVHSFIELTYKGVKFFIHGHSIYQYIDNSVIYFKRGDVEHVNELVRDLRSRQKVSKELYLYGSRWINVGRFDTTQFVEPSRVEGDMRRLVIPQLKEKKVFNHVLFYSPPGYGKTAYIRRLAQEFLDWTFIVVTPAVIEKPDNLLCVYSNAESYVPVVVFFEDIDSIGQNRDYTSSQFNPYLGALLNCMDGIGSREDVMTIASTNNQMALDPALLRAGRFGIKIPFQYTRREKVDILNRYMRSSYVEGEVGFIDKLSPSDIRAVARTVLSQAKLDGTEVTVDVIRDTSRKIQGEAKVLLQWNSSPQSPVPEDKPNVFSAEGRVA